MNNDSKTGSEDCNKKGRETFHFELYFNNFTFDTPRAHFHNSFPTQHILKIELFLFPLPLSCRCMYKRIIDSYAKLKDQLFIYLFINLQKMKVSFIRFD